jgi:hypothetical protein
MKRILEAVPEIICQSLHPPSAKSTYANLNESHLITPLVILFSQNAAAQRLCPLKPFVGIRVIIDFASRVHPVVSP